jgi:hypothetical protein
VTYVLTLPLFRFRTVRVRVRVQKHFALITNAFISAGGFAYLFRNIHHFTSLKFHFPRESRCACPNHFTGPEQYIVQSEPVQFHDIAYFTLQQSKLETELCTCPTVNIYGVHRWLVSRDISVYIATGWTTEELGFCF